MKRIQKAAFAVAAGSLALLASAATAQQQRPPRPDLAKMAESMGVSEDALKSCMGARGERPKDKSSEGGRPPKPDAAKISACLNEAGHDVTEKGVGETLASFAPKRRSN